VPYRKFVVDAAEHFDFLEVSGGSGVAGRQSKSHIPVSVIGYCDLEFTASIKFVLASLRLSERFF